MTENTAPTQVKCLVWDLDNTLWKGTLLEGDDPVPDTAVRDVIITLDSRGILQAIASKNDHDHAWERLEQLGLAEYFVLPHINWGPKSRSVRQIADLLSFTHKTIAFVDDQPAERAEVEYHLPEVRTYDAGRVLDLPDMPEFSPRVITVDARKRRQMYRAGFERDRARENHSGPDEDFLRSLSLVLGIDRAGDEELSRVEELTLRTSQMNATGVHYSDATLRTLVDDPAHEVLTATLTDRFGPHGAVGMLLLERKPGVWHLKLLATSCRVVSFGTGTAILNWLVNQAALNDVHMVADFRPTDRNRMMEIAYRFAGFTEEPCGCIDDILPTPEKDIQRLHLFAERRDPPTTFTIEALDL